MVFMEVFRFVFGAAKMYRLVVLIAFLALTNGQSTHVSQCTYNPGDLPLQVYISGCVTQPCLLPQLQDAVLDITFRAPRAIKSMRTLVSVFMFSNIPIPYDLGKHSDTCNFLQDSSCPVKEGELLNYQLKMFIYPFYPAGAPVPVEIRVVDENNLPVLCLRVVLGITKPQTGSNPTQLVADQ